MAAGCAPLAGLGAESSRGAATLAMVVLGLGIGLVMRNLLLVVQNTVPSRGLGIATSATQFLRSTGVLIPEEPLRRSVHAAEPLPAPA